MKILISLFLIAYGPIASAETCPRLPFRLIDNRIFLDTLVNGQGPYQFILDTGSSSNAIDTAAAKALGLPLTDPFPVGGAGPGQQTGYHTKVSSVQMGAIEMADPATVVVPMENVRKAIGFARFDGIIGARIFQDRYVEIDFSNNSLLACPPSHEFSGQGEILPMRLDADTATPVVSARIDGAAGDFIVDTGDRTTLTVFEDFTRRNAIKDHYSRVINLITGEGVGGPIRADVLRLGSFALGEKLFQNFPVRFPLAADFSAGIYAGSIGNGLLKTHDIIFDYAHGKLVLLAPSGLGYQSYDRSGLWLVTNENGFRVSDVVPQSAAWNAGIRKDDVLTSVGGKGFSRWSLPALREFLASPEAKTVPVRASRGGQSLEFTMHPFPLI